MKRFLLFFGLLIGGLLLGLFLWGLAVNESLPNGKSGPEADALARKMLTALNSDAYRGTRYLEWSYRNGKNNYRWDKQKGSCTVSWEDNMVDLILADPGKSKGTLNGIPTTGKKREEQIAYALKNFHNDSFWLVAPYKVFDSGTQRKIVPLENGEEGLLITYTSGGTTPGDSYLWLLNDNGFPYAFKMWAAIIPIGGVEASWDDWIVAQSGAFLPKYHRLGFLDLSMGEVKGYN